MDEATKISYTSDAQYVDTGTNHNISAAYEPAVSRQLSNLRSFPEGIKNCYTIKPEQANCNKYLIRAIFMYGNYDSKNEPPEFDLYLDGDRWGTIKFKDASANLFFEIIHVPATAYIHVCLVKTSSGTPFISALELRPLDNSIYEMKNGSLKLFTRIDVGSTKNDTVRYSNDIYDRIWSPATSVGFTNSRWKSIQAPFTSGILSSNVYKLPSLVMNTAAIPVNGSDSLDFYWEPEYPNQQIYVYMHFAAIEQLGDGELREFQIYFNDALWIRENINLSYLQPITIYSTASVTADSQLNFSIRRTKNSNRPPILNAIELYEVLQLHSPTDQSEVDAMVNIALTYGLKKNSQGDPCLPMGFSWHWVNCRYNGNNSPQVIGLNLSSSDLNGDIAPALSALKSLQYLDLSNNSLTGPVPEFLAQLPHLEILNLASNDLTGSVPKALSKKSSLSLSLDGNPNLCQSDTCEQTKKKKKNPSTVIIVASVVLSVVLLSAIAILWSLKRRRHTGRTLKSRNRRFTYSEVVTITNNFQKVIGKGGFGSVYLGHLEDGTQVAVKMLSRSSSQGSEQFWTEAELLTTVHHRNLASLIGYCDEGSNTALIYEYMANGNLQECLLDKNRAVLTWEQRLQIAIDAAQALEYLHNGCKPPIIHRDIKTANILLTEKLQAIVADFGLSRIFPDEDGSHITTAVVGTFGYLDPEYYITSRLTEKSDVYSFGVVLLELITGQPAIIKSEENTHIVEWVMPRIERGEISSIADPRLQGDFDSNSVCKMLETAIACVPSSPIQRLTTNQVLGELNECLEIYLASRGPLEIDEVNKSSSRIDYLCDPLDLESSMSGRVHKQGIAQSQQQHEGSDGVVDVGGALM
ncbi:hypothetical protein Vadar_001240 [Vaccinium darrowii]|uniref:Uncharacterized protein n=1 Tax=Vaccinium darrowii TaxID=229202 RepID=A0ACB7ZGH3_9ERIC|nr:hypothetical protein Vadar_001240 [Vaccinium darrowii]